MCGLQCDDVEMKLFDSDCQPHLALSCQMEELLTMKLHDAKPERDVLDKYPKGTKNNVKVNVWHLGALRRDV